MGKEEKDWKEEKEGTDDREGYEDTRGLRRSSRRPDMMMLGDSNWI